jgi:uncharacterized protein YbjT (DUF2867 family)
VEDDMITVMGATGNTGRKVADSLLRVGEKVRVLGRSRAKLAPLEKAGAEALAGQPNDAKYLTKAFSGADAVYTLLASGLDSADYRHDVDEQGEAIVQALREARVGHVVLVSSLGADEPSGTGPIAGLHAQEERLEKLVPRGTNVLALRPGYFFENFHSTLPLIKHQGINAGALAPDLAIPMIATRDIADVAAKALRAHDWNGVVVRELLGPRDLSQAEATRILGERLGKPDVRYVQLPYEEMAAALTKAGLSASVAGLFVEMDRAMNDGRVVSLEGRTPQNTTPTRFEDFVGELAEAYAAA